MTDETDEAGRRDKMRNSLEGMRDALTKMLDTYKPDRDAKPPDMKPEEWVAAMEKHLAQTNDMLKLYV